MAERLPITPLPTSKAELYKQFEEQINKVAKPDFEDTFEIFTGRGNLPLAEKVGNLLGKEVHNAVRGEFADGEEDIKLPTNVRRRDVFVLQAGAPDPASRVMELNLIADAATRASAEKISAIMPYFPYSRQDRKSESRTPISAARTARNMIRSGIDHVLTVDLHNEAIIGTINEPWDNVYARKVLIPAVEATGMKDIVVASPDAGGGKRAEAYLRRLKRLNIANEMALVYKTREEQGPNESEALFIAGNVEGKNVLVVDDIIDSGGTMMNTAKMLKDHGAESVSLVATHGLFSRKKGASAIEKIEHSAIDRLIVTDTILQSDETRREIEQSSKIEEVSIAPMLAVSILCYLTGDSIGKRLIN
jgi:ribose-phosphate pyrophosphokinase